MARTRPATPRAVVGYKYDKPLDYDPCVGCQLCVVVCPVGAIDVKKGLDFNACMTHNYRDFMGGFEDWVENIVESNVSWPCCHFAMGHRDRLAVFSCWLQARHDGLEFVYPVLATPTLAGRSRCVDCGHCPWKTHAPLVRLHRWHLKDDLRVRAGVG